MARTRNEEKKPTRSAAQIKADAKYAERNRANQKENYKNIAATLPKAEALKIAAIFKAHGIKPAEVIRRAAVRLEQGDNLRQDYDRATNTLQPAAPVNPSEGDSTDPDTNASEEEPPAT